MTLGSILVRLSMNTADFETDAGRASKVAQRRAKEIDDAFRKAGTAIGIAFSLAMAGTVVAIKKTIDNMDELSKSAQRVGLPTEDFSRLAYAGSLADVEVSSLITTLGKLTKSQSAAMKETSEQAKVFDALGISVTDSSGKMRSSMDVLKDFADRFKQMNGSPEAMAAGFALFGRSFQEIIPLIKDGSKGLSDMADESDRLGATLSTTAGIAAEKSNDDMTRLQTIIGGVWKEIAIGLLPNLDDAALKMQGMAKQGDLARNATTLLSTALGFGVGALAEYNNAVARVSISIGVLAEIAGGVSEVMKNILTLGFADGGISSGIDRQLNAVKKGQEELDQLIADQGLQAAGMNRADYNKSFQGQFQVNIPGMNKPIFEAGKFNFAEDQTKRLGKTADKAEDYAARINAALAGNTPKGGAKKSSGGKSDAQKLSDDAARAAKQAEDAQRRWNGSILDMEASLAGPVAEAQREFERNTQQIKKDFDDGNVSLADYAKGLEIYAEQRDREIKAINDRKTPAQKMLEDMQFEITLIGKTREEQELLNAARYLGAKAATVQGQAALAAMKLSQDTAKATGQQVEAMDALRDAAKGFFSDVAHGASVWDALSSAFDKFADKLFDMASSNVIDQLFGQMGSTQGGSAGGGWGSILGALFGGGGSGVTAFSRNGVSGSAFASAFDGLYGFASGGYTGAGGRNQAAGIVHRGEVVWSQGDIARAGGLRNVEGMRRGGSRGGGSITINNNIRGDVNARTSDQYAAKTAERLQRASRNR